MQVLPCARDVAFRLTTVAGSSVSERAMYREAGKECRILLVPDGVSCYKLYGKLNREIRKAE